MPPLYDRKLFSHNGFTLIEVLLVVVIIASIAFVSIPGFRGTFKNLSLNSNTNDIAYLMRYAQAKAITLRKPVTFVFDEEYKHYWLEARSGADAPDGGEESEQGERLSGKWGKTFKIAEDIELEGAPLSFVFKPNGEIEKVLFSLCDQKNCKVISTKDYRGQVEIYDVANAGL